MMRAADLFAGGGGLSVGLERAGYDVVASLEANQDAAETYKANHPRTKVLCKDIRKVSPTELYDGPKLELLAACPPCQGFTSLTSKYRRDDPRNHLVAQVMRYVQELKPQTFMMENVPRLATSELGRKQLDPVLRRLEQLGYKVSWYILDATDFGVSQHRRRLVVFASSQLVEKPEANDEHKKKKNTVRSTIGRLRKEAYTYDARKSKPMLKLKDWHCHRRMDGITRQRLSYAKMGGSRLDIPKHLRPPCHQTNDKGFLNTYSRMSWEEPSPTITAGCLTMSKGRFGHPEKMRTITLREAGRFQGFSDDFVLTSKSLETNLSIIGNAFPADLAAASVSKLHG